MVSVTLILPTYNEAENVVKILRRVMSWGHNVIVVDDNSPDGTANVARAHFEGHFRRRQFKVLVRKDQRGLGSAIRTAAVVADTPWVAVMDCDGQHSPSDMFALLVHADEDLADIYIGSRLTHGGTIKGLSWWRRLATKVLNRLGGFRARSKASDYLTGMFIAKREHVVQTKENGFKILYDILKHNELKVAEVPITLHKREGGESKAGFMELSRYLKLVFS